MSIDFERTAAQAVPDEQQWAHAKFIQRVLEAGREATAEDRAEAYWMVKEFRQQAHTAKDAARYRWLRNNTTAEYPAVFRGPGLDDSGWYPCDGEALDVAIDAAMQKGTTK